jgi:hypothetical protein
MVLFQCLIILGVDSPAQLDESNPYSQHPMWRVRSAEEVEHERQEEIKRLEERLQEKSLTPFVKTGLQRSLYRTRAIAFAAIGYHGEIIIGSDKSIVEVDAPEIALLILPTESGGLELLHAENIGVKKEVYARVGPDGKIVYESTLPPIAATDIRRPEKWPREKESGRWHIPPESQAIYRQIKSDSALEEPENSLGYCRRLANNWLLAVEEGTIAGDAIWVVRRNDGGLNLVHSGPTERGLFASISPGCVVEHGASLSKPRRGNLYWGLATEVGLPAFVDSWLFTMEKTEFPEIVLLNSGNLSYPEPEIE